MANKIKYNSKLTRWELIDGYNQVIDYAVGSYMDNPASLTWSSVTVSSGTSVNCTAVESDILVGDTAISRGNLRIGTMTDNGQVVYTPKAEGFMSGPGYYDSVYIAGDSDLKAENIKEGVTIFGIRGEHVGGSTNTTEVTYGYINNDGKFQPVSLEGSVPVDTGAAEDVDVVMFNTGITEPDYVIKTTATAEDITAGKTAVLNGVLVEGTGSSEAAGPGGSYVELEETTYTPGTEDIVLEAGTLLTGNQTIKGDPNLKPEYIKLGITIFGVTGTYEQEAAVTLDCYRVKGSSYDGINGDYVDTNVRTYEGYAIYKNTASEMYLSVYKNYGERNWAFREGSNGTSKMVWENVGTVSTLPQFIFYLGEVGSELPSTPEVKDGYEYLPGTGANGASAPISVEWRTPEA